MFDGEEPCNPELSVLALAQVGSRSESSGARIFVVGHAPLGRSFPDMQA